MSQDVSKPSTQRQPLKAESMTDALSNTLLSTDEHTASSTREKQTDALALSDPPATQPLVQAGQTNRKANPVVAVHNLTKIYQLGRQIKISALQNVSLTINAGEFVAVMGPSGSGKSTFMNILGCLDRPTSGEYRINGYLVSSLSNDELADIRNRLIGFVFQGFNLLGRATTRKNVELPLVYAGYPKEERERRARKVLALVGLSRYLNHKPTELSGGQQQRVAIARALINGPSLLLADEPTGNLDSQTGIEIMTLLRLLNERGLTIVLVTHDHNIAGYAKRIVQFLDGCLISDEPVSEPQVVSNK
jgi:putative ABC transport system ATP-binding protein